MMHRLYFNKYSLIGEETYGKGQPPTINSDFTTTEDGDFFFEVSFLQINPLSVRQFLFSHFPAKLFSITQFQNI